MNATSRPRYVHVAARCSSAPWRTAPVLVEAGGGRGCGAARTLLPGAGARVLPERVKPRVVRRAVPVGRQREGRRRRYTRVTRETTTHGIQGNTRRRRKLHSIEIRGHWAREPDHTHTHARTFFETLGRVLKKFTQQFAQFNDSGSDSVRTGQTFRSDTAHGSRTHCG